MNDHSTSLYWLCQCEVIKENKVVYTYAWIRHNANAKQKGVYTIIISGIIVQGGVLYTASVLHAVAS